MHFVIKKFASAGVDFSSGGCDVDDDDSHKVKQQKHLQISRWRCHLTLKSAIFFLSLGILLTNLPGTLSKEADEDNDKTTNVSAIDRLRLQLFVNYDKNSQPTHRGVPTNITLGMTINYVDIDETKGKLTMHSWLNVRWMDDNRSWNETEYENITQIHLKPREVWKPDITLFNSAGDGGNYLGDTQVLLSHDGSFLWVPPVIYTAYCNLNLLMWPYDVQTCKIKVGSWTLTYIDDKRSSNNLDFSELIQSTEWEIKDGKAAFHQKDYYNYMEYTLIMQRRSTMYTAVIFTPASCIVLLALSTFWLPPQMGEKILLNCIVIVVIAAFLMYFAQLLPILAENTPLVVLFYSSCLLLLSLSTLIAVLVLYLSTAKHKRRVPDPLKNVLNGGLGRILLLSQFELEAEPHSSLNNGTKELGEHVYDSPDTDSITEITSSINPMPTNRSLQFDWILLATAIDRIAFLCYCFIFIVLAIVYSV